MMMEPTLKPFQERDPVNVLPRVGPKTAAELTRMGIETIQDLLAWFPRNYLDATRPQAIATVRPGVVSAVRVTVDRTQTRRSRTRGLPMFEATCSDASGSILVRWFNQTFLAQTLVPGSEWILIGTVQRYRGETVMLSPQIERTPGILAFYPQSRQVTTKMLRGYVDWALQRTDYGSSSAVPEELQVGEGLISLPEAIKSIHQPGEMGELAAARERLAFEEVFRFFLQVLRARSERGGERGIPVSYEVAYLRKLVSRLPYVLTDGQKRAIWEILKECESGKPMLRLLNGDVGSGKTAVASIVAAVFAKAGYQTAILVPTDLLARQHRESIAKLLEPIGTHVGSWTASRKETTDADVVVGTHALLESTVSLPRLGFVVIDEQHRFGVRQRQLLRDRAVPPHVLSMTATPIPRTLALVLYGDLSVSYLREKPVGRLPVATEIIRPEQRTELHERIVSELSAGHQVIVICPLIKEKPEVEADDGPITLFDESERVQQERKTVLAEVARLRQEHPEYGTVEAVHGKLKPAEKEAIMARVAAGAVQVLVATSVIEVGIDLPNVTVMVVENAERFGLAQLHQFRGRVGRGTSQSYCYLCPGSTYPAVRERLQVLVESNDGFVVAERDLQLRGPGELTGQVQSGLPDFKMAQLTDLEYLTRVRKIVELYTGEHPEILRAAGDDPYSRSWGSLE